MPRFLPWLVLLFPALELWVLIQVGDAIGALATVGLVIVSMFIGLGLLRLRSLHIVRTIQTELASGRVPSGQIIDSFCLMLAGCLFIFPGFVSDVLALLLLIPGIRHLLLGFFSMTLRARGYEAQTVHYTANSTDDSGSVTWTCTTFGTDSATPPDSPHTLRGNAVIIDCDPDSSPSNQEIDVTPPDSNDRPAS